MLGTDWQLSTKTQGGGSVEVRRDVDGDVYLRDTDNTQITVRIRPVSWRAFIAGVREGEFDIFADDEVPVSVNH